jgi:hypothetical protein
MAPKTGTQLKPKYSRLNQWNNGLEDLKGLTYEEHVKCPLCMIGKATLEDFPKSRQVKVKLLHQINVDSSSIPPLRDITMLWYFIDKCTGYRRIYGTKTKDQMINVVKRWYSDIADLRTKHKLVVVFCDNVGENKSQEVKEFFESKGIRNHFSTPRTLRKNIVSSPKWADPKSHQLCTLLK